MCDKYYKKMKINKVLILICTFFIGIGALFGGFSMIIAPDGSILQMQEMLIYFKKLPFSEFLFKDYLFSGISLVIVNGITNILASILILKNKKIGYILGTIFGITLMLWICIQFYMFAPNIYIIDIVFFLIGLVQFIIGYISYVNFMQISFVFNEDEYNELNDYDNTENIVVCFSRMNYTKKLAYEKAKELKCKVICLKSLENVNGTIGFWWCGRFGMHKWKMNIEDIDINLSSFKNIHIFSPIWVFHICGPIRSFIDKYKNDFNNVHLILVHYTNISYSKEFMEIEKMISKKLASKTSICSKKGIVKNIKQII